MIKIIKTEEKLIVIIEDNYYVLSAPKVQIKDEYMSDMNRRGI
jgi:hypothetical protein